MTSGTQWSMRGDYFENCNCDVICPCSPTRGQARPDKGNCDVILAFNVAEGNHGDVSLDGLNFVLVLTTPGPMGEGNGTAAAISTSDAVEGAIPIVHTRCTIIKIHGDYLDTRIKNTPKDLEQYDDSMNSLLDRILDEFGLIVCGEVEGNRA